MKTPRNIDRIAKRYDLVAYLNIPDSLFRSWRKDEDFPETARRGHYNVEFICKWIIKKQHTFKSKHSRGAVKPAQEFLEKLEATRQKDRDAQTKLNAKRAEKKSDMTFNEDGYPVLTFRSEELGMVGSLSRHEDTEAFYAQMVKYWTEKGEYRLSVQAQDGWSKAAEHLRKSKMETIKILQQEGDLIPLEVAQDFVAKCIMPLQRALLKIPKTVSPELENLEKEDIEIILDRVIREVLTEAARSQISVSD